jgi:hypothetical protein
MPLRQRKKYKRCCLVNDQAAEHNGLRLVVSNTDSKPIEWPTTSAAAPAPKPDRTKKKLTQAELHRIINQDLEWTNFYYRKLADYLVKSMEPEFDRTLIMEAVLLWNDFSTETQPIFQKSGSFCAALEYYIGQAYGFPITQADVAPNIRYP